MLFSNVKTKKFVNDYIAKPFVSLKVVDRIGGLVGEAKSEFAEGVGGREKGDVSFAETAQNQKRADMFFESLGLGDFLRRGFRHEVVLRR